MKNTMQISRSTSGFTLIEALVAAIVLSIGLLGLAGLQATSQKLTRSAYQRTKAANLAYMMADAIRANSRNIDKYIQILEESDPEPCDPQFAQNTGEDAATNDIGEWLNAISCAFPGTDYQALGEQPTISRNGNQVTVTIPWDEQLAWKSSEDDQQDDSEDLRDQFSLTIQL